MERKELSSLLDVVHKVLGKPSNCATKPRNQEQTTLLF